MWKGIQYEGKGIGVRRASTLSRRPVVCGKASSLRRRAVVRGGASSLRRRALV